MSIACTHCKKEDTLRHNNRGQTRNKITRTNVEKNVVHLEVTGGKQEDPVVSKGS